jgi:hypothetical protein
LNPIVFHCTCKAIKRKTRGGDKEETRRMGTKISTKQEYEEDETTARWGTHHDRRDTCGPLAASWKLLY